MRIAAYIRVSTDEQAAEGYSIPAQKERLTAFCVSQGWNVVNYYIDDGESAKDLMRPELQQLLKDAERALFDIVLVYRLDRLTRSVIDLYSLLQTFEKHSIKFKSATEVYDTTTAMGRLFITLVAALAQWERENLGERVRFGMEQMVREGKRPGGPVPFGYDVDGKTIIPEEEEVLRELRRLYMEEKLGFKPIAMKLNQRGMYRRGIEWSAQSVWYVLENPYYAGKLRWGSKKPNGKYATRKKEERVELIWQDSDQEKIFTWEEYEAHTTRMKKRSFYGYSRVRDYWFTGVLRCGKCGSRMSGRYHQNKRQDGSHLRILSYICGSRQAGKACTMPMFRQELVEHLIMEYIRKLSLDESLNTKVAREQREAIEKSENEANKLKAELSKIEERRKRWQYMFVEELITIEDLRKRKAEEDEKEREIQSRLREMSNFEDEDDEIMNLLAGLPELWPIMDDAEKASMIQTIFTDIVLDTPLERARGKKGQFIPAHIVRVEYN